MNRPFKLVMAGMTLLLASVISNVATAQNAGGIEEDDAREFATKLGLIQGHLWVAAELVEIDLFELGSRHAKHPAEEVYQELLPYFVAIKSPGFADDLEGMSALFGPNTIEAFRQSFARVMQKIDSTVTDLNLTDLDKLEVARRLVLQASEEYGVGVNEGLITDLQEYQDARGFLYVAESFVDQTSVAQRDELLGRIKAASALWPNLNPEAEIAVNSELLAELNEGLEAAVSIKR